MFRMGPGERIEGGIDVDVIDHDDAAGGQILPGAFELEHDLDFAHFGVREAKLGIQKIGIEFEFSSEAPA
jgi:hypothetical protein